MMFVTALGELPEAVLGLTFGMGCALGLGFLCLRLLVGFVTREGQGTAGATAEMPEVQP
jgi:ABC-type transporter Mla subunit MlaD